MMKEYVKLIKQLKIKWIEEVYKKGQITKDELEVEIQQIENEKYSKLRSEKEIYFLYGVMTNFNNDIKFFEKEKDIEWLSKQSGVGIRNKKGSKNE